MGGGGCCRGNCCVGNCCVSNYSSSSGGSTSSYDARAAELEQTIKVQNALTEFREDTRAKSEKFENDVIKASRETLDAFLKDVKKYNNIKYGGNRLNVNLSQIERENRKTEDKIHGFITKRVSKRASLDDTECLAILKLDAGKEKQQKLNDFYKKILNEAIKDLSEVLRDAMEKQTDIVEDHISSRIEIPIKRMILTKYSRSKIPMSRKWNRNKSSYLIL